MFKNLVILGSLLSMAQAGPCKPHSLSTTGAVATSFSAETVAPTSTPAPPADPTTTTPGPLEPTTTAPVEVTTTTTPEALEPTTTAPAEVTTTTTPEPVEPTTTTLAVITTTPAVEPTTTTAEKTTTSNKPEPSSCVIDANCGATGWNVEYYANVFEEGYGNDEMSVPASYYITENLKPIASGMTNEVYFPQDYMSDLNRYKQTFPNPKYAGKAYYVGYKRTLNGDITVDANSFTLVYRGYYKAPSTGEYELCIQADNANTLFFGDGNAFKCGSGEPDVDAPALVLAATGYHFNNPVRCGKVNLIKGRTYPVRNVMGNKNAVSMLEFTIKAPGEKATHNFAGRAFPVECGGGK